MARVAPRKPGSQNEIESPARSPPCTLAAMVMVSETLLPTPRGEKVSDEVESALVKRGPVFWAAGHANTLPCFLSGYTTDAETEMLRSASVVPCDGVWKSASLLIEAENSDAPSAVPSMAVVVVRVSVCAWGFQLASLKCEDERAISSVADDLRVSTRYTYR